MLPQTVGDYSIMHVFKVQPGGVEAWTRIERKTQTDYASARDFFHRSYLRGYEIAHTEYSEQALNQGCDIFRNAYYDTSESNAASYMNQTLTSGDYTDDTVLRKAILSAGYAAIPLVINLFLSLPWC